MTDKTQIQIPETKICLTIAGLDPSGGAGIIADIKTFTAFGCFATSAVTSLTFQNTVGVFGAIHQTAESVRGQIEPVLQDFKLSALKTGMLPTREVIEEVARIVRENKLKNFVVDPVVRSTSGFDLIDDAALESLIESLFPLSDLITPNVPEAERIARMKIKNETDIRSAARVMLNLGAKAVIIKGGHLPNLGVETFETQASESPGGDGRQAPVATDFMFFGKEELTFSAEFIETDATHGTGCTFAAAIAAGLAKGKTLAKAVESAKKFVTEAIRTAPNLGRGHSPVNHSVPGFEN
jgi:hydroxymethylpyrimidine kinase/phosphomethylpyrimidine kinase